MKQYKMNIVFNGVVVYRGVVLADDLQQAREFIYDQFIYYSHAEESEDNQ